MKMKRLEALVKSLKNLSKKSLEDSANSKLSQSSDYARGLFDGAALAYGAAAAWLELELEDDDGLA